MIEVRRQLKDADRHLSEATATLEIEAEELRVLEQVNIQLRVRAKCYFDFKDANRGWRSCRRIRKSGGEEIAQEHQGEIEDNMINCRSSKD